MKSSLSYISNSLPIDIVKIYLAIAKMYAVINNVDFLPLLSNLTKISDHKVYFMKLLVHLP